MANGTANPLLDRLTAEFEAKSKKSNDLLNSTESTFEQIQEAKGIIEKDLPELKTQIETVGSTEELKTRLAGHQQWMNAPAHTLPRPGMAEIIGLKSAGYSQMGEEKGESVLYSEGEGLLSDAQMKTLHDPEYATAFKTMLRKKGVNTLSGTEIKTLSEGLDQDGGYLVPVEMLNRIIERKPTPTRISGAVTSLTTSRDALVLPKANYAADDIYTSGIRVNWTGEGGNPGNTGQPQFGTQRINVYTAMLKLNLTNDVLEDTGFGLQAHVGNKFQETVDILRDVTAVSGTGNGMPRGMLTGIDEVDRIISLASGAAGTFTADQLLEMAYDIPEQYLENLRWLFSRTKTEKVLAKIKDDNKRPLFYAGDDSYANARPSSLLGFPITRSALMPAPEAGKYPIIFGDLSGYAQVDRVGFSVRVLDQTEAENNQIVLLGRLRMGGDVIEPWKMRAMQIRAA